MAIKYIVAFENTGGQITFLGSNPSGQRIKFGSLALATRFEEREDAAAIMYDEDQKNGPGIEVSVRKVEEKLVLRLKAGKADGVPEGMELYYLGTVLPMMGTLTPRLAEAHAFENNNAIREEQKTTHLLAQLKNDFDILQTVEIHGMPETRIAVSEEPTENPTPKETKVKEEKKVSARVFTICHSFATEMMYAGVWNFDDVPDYEETGLKEHINVGQSSYYFTHDPKRVRYWDEAEDAFRLAKTIGQHLAKFHPKGVKVEIKHGRIEDGKFIEEPCDQKHFWDSTENDGRGSTMFQAGLLSKKSSLGDILNAILAYNKPLPQLEIDESHWTEEQRDLVISTLLPNTRGAYEGLLEYLGAGIVDQINILRNKNKNSNKTKEERVTFLTDKLTFLKDCLESAFEKAEAAHNELMEKSLREKSTTLPNVFGTPEHRAVSAATILEALHNKLPQAIRKADRNLD